MYKGLQSFAFLYIHIYEYELSFEKGFIEIRAGINEI